MSRDTFYAVTVFARPMGWRLLSPRAWVRGRDVAHGLQVVLKLRMDALAQSQRVPVVMKKGKEINH